MKLVFPYSVKFPRTGSTWWSHDWREISNWCSSSIGECTKDWEYQDERFWFTKERDKLLFLLRWK